MPLHLHQRDVWIVVQELGDEGEGSPDRLGEARAPMGEEDRLRRLDLRAFDGGAVRAAVIVEVVVDRLRLLGAEVVVVGVSIAVGVVLRTAVVVAVAIGVLRRVGAIVLAIGYPVAIRVLVSAIAVAIDVILVVAVPVILVVAGETESDTEGAEDPHGGHAHPLGDTGVESEAGGDPRAQVEVRPQKKLDGHGIAGERLVRGDRGRAAKLGLDPDGVEMEVGAEAEEELRSRARQDRHREPLRRVGRLRPIRETEVHDRRDHGGGEGQGRYGPEADAAVSGQRLPHTGGQEEGRREPQPEVDAFLRTLALPDELGADTDGEIARAGARHRHDPGQLRAQVRTRLNPRDRKPEPNPHEVGHAQRDREVSREAVLDQKPVALPAVRGRRAQGEGAVGVVQHQARVEGEVRRRRRGEEPEAFVGGGGGRIAVEVEALGFPSRRDDGERRGRQREHCEEGRGLKTHISVSEGGTRATHRWGVFEPIECDLHRPASPT